MNDEGKRPVIITVSDNPLVSLTLQFKDGAWLRQVCKPVSQFEAMRALGKMLADMGQEMNFELGFELDTWEDQISVGVDSGDVDVARGQPYLALEDGRVEQIY
ncbi:hypothetical protein LCGC14_1272740, partial [marine sediment metagenome]